MKISTDIVLIMVESIILLGLVVMNIILIRKRKVYAQRRSMEAVQLREMDLDRLISNSSAEQSGSGSKQLRPYEEKYMSESKAPLKAVDGIKIELKVHTALAEKKYLTSVHERMTIGSAASNELVIDSRNLTELQCVLIRNGDKLLFQKLSKETKVVIERNHVKKTLSDKPIVVVSNDIFYVEDVVVEIRFI